MGERAMGFAWAPYGEVGPARIMRRAMELLAVATRDRFLRSHYHPGRRACRIARK